MIEIKSIQEMTSGGAVSGGTAGTTSANVAFIPGEVGVVKPKTKKTEEMSVEELDEAISSDFNELIETLTAKFDELEGLNQLRDIQRVFYSLFPKTQPVQIREKVLINISNYGNGISSILKEINRRLSNDSGYLERLISALEDSLPLNSFKIFKDYSFLAGLSLQSNYQDVIIRLDAKCNMALENSQAITISDDEVVQDMKHYTQVNGNVIQPATNRVISILQNLKAVISSQKKREV